MRKVENAALIIFACNSFPHQRRNSYDCFNLNNESKTELKRVV